MGCGGKGSVRVMWSADEERVAILYRIIRDSLLIEREHLGKSVLGRERSKIKKSIKWSSPECSGNSKDASVGRNYYVRRREWRKKESNR